MLTTAHLSVHIRVFTQALAVRCGELGIEHSVESAPSETTSPSLYGMYTGTVQINCDGTTADNAVTIAYLRGRSIAEIAYEAGRDGLEMLTVSCDGAAPEYPYAFVSTQKGLARCFGDATQLAKLTRLLTAASEEAYAGDEEMRQAQRTHIQAGAFLCPDVDAALALPFGAEAIQREASSVRAASGRLMLALKDKMLSWV